ncbi:MAG: hypothetical protein KatS3mg038_1030 [Candidatus Kapaibacterium sp.]|nr:MAG: hypothetical protein KatS3mg038_1030 [Candidatus Kapabacteria bacterium]
MSDNAEFLRRILSALESRNGRYSSGGRELSCRCPFHDDTRNSFSINCETGVFYCHVPTCGAHRRQYGLHDLANHLGIPAPERPRPRGEGESVRSGNSKLSPELIPQAIYTYYDEHGAEVQQVLRYASPDGGKTFRQRHRGPDGKWIWRAARRQVPYRLPELLAALNDPAQIIFVVEGEKDVDTCHKYGLVATCNAMGAGKWRDAHAEYFRGARARVVVLADNDEAGLEHARKVSETLARVGCMAPILVPSTRYKGDITDWFEQGGTPENLLEMARAVLEMPDARASAQSEQPKAPVVERAVLACYMANPPTFHEHPIKPEYLTGQAARALYHAICECVMEGLQPTPVNLAARLRRDSRLEDWGGISGLNSLLAEAAQVDDMATLVAQLREAATKRSVAALGQKLASFSAQDALDRQALLQQVWASFEEFLASEQGDAVTHSLRRIDEHLGIFLSDVEAASMGTIRRHATGLSLFDDLVAIEPHRLYLFAGRPGMGKTSWLLFLSNQLAEHGAKVAFFSLEMNSFQILRRLTAACSGINPQRIGAPDMTSDEWLRFFDAFKQISNRTIWLSDAARVSIDDVFRQCLALKRIHGLDVIVIDYLSLLEVGKFDTEARRLDAIARDLKILAGRLEVAVIAAAQVNRDVEDRTDRCPRLSDLYGSSGMEAHSDTVAVIYRPGYYDPRADPTEFHLRVLKQRDGRLGSLVLSADLARASFRPYSAPCEVRL